ncbi:MAG: hypothetical protein KM312_04705 [Hydrogenibacillus schlegelii]|uniref:Uncharacterized protein n=1 Tax=Hydrogenibacillus schlegelii TaxID=1484 RepID=A0A947D339_HYDSH|nr:hypothetical protein [Hydrogenibacillus schlegelii]
MARPMTSPLSPGRKARARGAGLPTENIRCTAKTTGGAFTPLERRFAWAGFVLMLAGTALGVFAILSNRATVLYTFYPPRRRRIGRRVRNASSGTFGTKAGESASERGWPLPSTTRSAATTSGPG